MYISYLFNWLYKVMQIPVPLVLSNEIYALVTIFDIFMFTLFIGIFIVLIRYLITNNLSLRVGSMSDFSYSPKFNSSYKSDVAIENIEDTSVQSSKTRTVRRQNFSNNSIGGRIINQKRQVEANKYKPLNKNSMGHRIVMSKFKNKESE